MKLNIINLANKYYDHWVPNAYIYNHKFHSRNQAISYIKLWFGKDYKDDFYHNKNFPNLGERLKELL